MKKIIPILVIMMVMVAPALSLAQNTTPPSPSLTGPNPQTGPTTVTQWFTIFQDIVGWAFTIAIVLGVLMLIIAGIMYMTAGGNQDKVGTAVKMVMYALIGVAIAGLAWALVNVVGNFFLNQSVI